MTTEICLAHRTFGGPSVGSWQHGPATARKILRCCYSKTVETLFQKPLSTSKYYLFISIIRNPTMLIFACRYTGMAIATPISLGLSWHLGNRQRTWEWRFAIYFHHSVQTPLKFNMERKNHPIEKENHLPSTSIFPFPCSFSGGYSNTVTPLATKKALNSQRRKTSLTFRSASRSAFRLFSKSMRKLRTLRFVQRFNKKTVMNLL